MLTDKKEECLNAAKGTARLLPVRLSEKTMARARPALVAPESDLHPEERAEPRPGGLDNSSASSFPIKPVSPRRPTLSPQWKSPVYQGQVYPRKHDVSMKTKRQWWKKNSIASHLLTEHLGETTTGSSPRRKGPGRVHAGVWHDACSVETLTSREL